MTDRKIGLLWQWAQTEEAFEIPASNLLVNEWAVRLDIANRTAIEWASRLDIARHLSTEWEAAATQISERAMFGDPAAAMVQVQTLRSCAEALRAVLAPSALAKEQEATHD